MSESTARDPLHATDDCTGTWRLAGSGRTRWIRCTACSAQLDASPDNRRAAIEENRAGLVLRRLTAEGTVRGERRPR